MTTHRRLISPVRKGSLAFAAYTPDSLHFERSLQLGPEHKINNNGDFGQYASWTLSAMNGLEEALDGV